MWKKLFGGKSAEDEVQLPPLTDGVRQAIFTSLGVKSLPAMPHAAQQAFQLATKPNAEAHDYIEVIEADEGLSAKTLKIANSVFYDRGGGSRTIADAVNVIGIAELRNLLNASALMNVFPLRHPLRSQLWAHDIATALTARLIAKTIAPHLADSAFLAGLMHDIGKLLLLQRHTESYAKLLKEGLSAGLESPLAEVNEYPFDHTHVGQLIGEQWRFTKELTMAIRCHHNDWSTFSGISLAALIKASDILTHGLNLGAERDTALYRAVYEPLVEPTWEFLKISGALKATIAREAQRCFETEYELYSSWGNG
jgi:HD-like signal output (HDOD) protein